MSTTLSDTSAMWLAISFCLFLYGFLKNYLGNEASNKIGTDSEVLWTIAESLFPWKT